MSLEEMVEKLIKTVLSSDIENVKIEKIYFTKLCSVLEKLETGKDPNKYCFSYKVIFQSKDEKIVYLIDGYILNNKVYFEKIKQWILR